MIFFCSCVLFSASSLVTRSSHIYQEKSSPIARISEKLTWVRTHWWCCRTTHSSTWRSQTSTWATIIWGARFSRKTPFVHFPFQVNTFFEQHLSILGNNIATLNNKELVVDLSNNNMRFMLESEWRPYIETRKSTGHCVLQVPETLLSCSLPLWYYQGNPLSCSCDMRWILSLNYQWSPLFRGADCQDGRKLTEVEPQLLDSMCPPPTCPGYNPILNTISSEGEF